MSRGMKIFIGILVSCLVMSHLSSGDEDRPIVKMESSKAEVVIDLGGGSISEYRLKTNDLNPMQWDSWSFTPTADEDPPMLPRPMGHFLCLDRWGSSSDAEKAHGMPNHGEKRLKSGGPYHMSWNQKRGN